MLEHTPPLPAGQVDCSVSEALALLNEADKQGLLPPNSAAELLKLECLAAIGDARPERAKAVQETMHRLLAGGPAAERALDAIAPLFDPAGVVEIRTLDLAGGAGSTFGRLGVPEERARLLDAVKAANGRRNVYFGVNPRKAQMLGLARAANAADVETRRGVFLDLDAKDATDADPDWSRSLAALGELGPCLVLGSGNGYHVHLSAEPVTDAGALAASVSPLAASMTRLGADNMADLPRIARMPFTVNLPKANKRQRGAVPRLAMPRTTSVAVPPSAPRPLSDLCRDLDGVASRLGLPGRGEGAATTLAATSAVVEPKTGWAAPSADLLRMAVRLVPNDAGQFDDRAEWVRFGHAVKGAAIAAGCESEGRVIWLEWCGKWSGPSDPYLDARFWDTCGTAHVGTVYVGWGTIMKTLERTNPAGRKVLHEAETKHAFAQDAIATHTALSGFQLIPVGALDPAKIPPRQWLYGRSAIAGFVSALVAPGGAGKSALAMVEAVAMATGHELLAGDKPVAPLRVWYHNAEDDRVEMERRLAATLTLHNLTHADLKGNLVVTSGRDWPLQLARTGPKGVPEITPGIVDAIVDRVSAAGVQVIVFDPIGAMHSVPENSNEAINMLFGALREIATRTGAAIVILHHTSKAAAGDMGAAGAGAARGASAFVDGARVVRQVVRMTPEDAKRFAIPEDQRGYYLRIDNGKANLAPAANAHWLRMVSVPLNNGAGLYPKGDEIGVPERWVPPKPATGTASDLAAVHTAISALPTPPRQDARSSEWVGYVVAGALGLDIGSPGTKPDTHSTGQISARRRVADMLAGWVADGGLIVIDGQTSNRRPTKCVGNGTPAVIFAAPDTEND